MASAPKKATAKAVKAEATNEDVTFEYDGETYTIPPTDDWDLEVLEAFEEGKIVALVRALLGDDQYATFKKKKRKLHDLNSFVEALQDASGMAGN